MIHSDLLYRMVQPCKIAAAVAQEPGLRMRTSPNIWDISGEVTKSPEVPKTSRLM